MGIQAEMDLAGGGGGGGGGGGSYVQSFYGLTLIEQIATKPFLASYTEKCALQHTKSPKEFNGRKA